MDVCSVVLYTYITYVLYKSKIVIQLQNILSDLGLILTHGNSKFIFFYLLKNSIYHLCI